MKLILTLLFLFITLSATAAEEESVYTKAKSLFISHEALPSKLYVGQVFPLRVKAIVAQERFDSLKAEFSHSTGASVKNPDATWESIGNSTYQATFYLALNSASAKLPLLHVTLFAKGTPVESEKLELPQVDVIKLKSDPLFSNVLAQSLSINKYKTTSFDAKNAMMVLEIDATMANLKDFVLSGVAKSGIDSFSENEISQKIYFYAIIPNYQKTFEFSYFDLRLNRFNKISLPVIIENDEVSTQLGLNPKESIFEFYKNIAYGVAALIFFLAFLRRRKISFFILMALFVALFIWDKNPLNKVELKSNSTLMILPTERSTVFFTSTQALEVEKLAERDKYSKVLLPDGKIGWTNHENIRKP